MPDPPAPNRGKETKPGYGRMSKARNVSGTGPTATSRHSNRRVTRLAPRSGAYRPSEESPATRAFAFNASLQTAWRKTRRLLRPERFHSKRPLMGVQEPPRDGVRASSPRRRSVRSPTRTGPRRSCRAKAAWAKMSEVQIPRPSGAQHSFPQVPLNSPPLPVDRVDNPVRTLSEPQLTPSPTLPCPRPVSGILCRSGALHAPAPVD